MIPPTARYRMQFRNGMTFERAAKFVPYLDALCVSHLYASPIFTAAVDSTHGYDVVDCNEIDPRLGGRESFDRLCKRLKTAGLGLILDIVPNHMAASIENAWWADVLRFGRRSQYADHFDIDWRERLTLPILGKPLDDTLRDGELELRRDVRCGEWRMAYFDTLLPLAPGSADRISNPKDRVEIARVHDAQHWRLMHWRDAARDLSYRRFFEITGLVGLRVENETVFEDSHRLILELIRSGAVQGLRVDHIDGLADPAGYLKRLRAAVGDEVYIIVEKIVGAGEALPQDWPVQGTTGYEFIAALSALLVEPEGLKKLAAGYADLSPETAHVAAGIRDAKLLMVGRNFAGEMARLVRLAMDVCPELDEEGVSSAIRELLIAFPVYRTYGNRGPLDVQDAAVLDVAVRGASERLRERRALAQIATVLRGGSHREFRVRFQQLSGPIMAKAIEDTFFYRHNRLIALNEVGGETEVSPNGLDVFHEAMQKRLETRPHALSGTSTHDTKRGEDARARLYALSEMPDGWLDGLGRWREMHRVRGDTPFGRAAPEPNTEWMLHQALCGIWPARNGEGGPALVDRFTAYANKAVREAKLVTSWDNPDGAYEEAVQAYAKAMADSDNRPFVLDFEETMAPLIAAGHENSLAQTLIKLVAPGIPDIYQGAEALDFSLVDPDNRRPVDMEELARALASDLPLVALTPGMLKQRLVRIGLHLRRKQPELFSKGVYVRLDARGCRDCNVIAFARQNSHGYAIALASRLTHGLSIAGHMPVRDDFWGDTTVALPVSLHGAKRELLTGQLLASESRLSVAELLCAAPVALIVPARDR